MIEFMDSRIQRSERFAMLLRLFAVTLFLPAPLVAQEWDGAYWGGGVTYSTGETEVVGSRFAFDINAAETRVPHELDGAGLTAFVGWNQRHGDVVFGAELRALGGELSDSVLIQGGRAIDDVMVHWRADLLGRVGYVAGETLLYAGGGPTFARISDIGGDLDGGALDVLDAHIREDIRIGATFMVGAEHRLGSGLILRGELSRTDFAPYREANQQGAPGSQFYIVDDGPISTVTLALVLEF
jgi:hypothetical protein